MGKSGRDSGSVVELGKGRRRRWEVMVLVGSGMGGPLMQELDQMFYFHSSRGVGSGAMGLEQRRHAVHSHARTRNSVIISSDALVSGGMQ